MPILVGLLSLIGWVSYAPRAGWCVSSFASDVDKAGRLIFGVGTPRLLKFWGFLPAIYGSSRIVIGRPNDSFAFSDAIVFNWWFGFLSDCNETRSRITDLLRYFHESVFPPNFRSVQLFHCAWNSWLADLIKVFYT